MAGDLDLTGFPDVDGTIKDAASVEGQKPAKVVGEFLAGAADVVPVGPVIERLRESAGALVPEDGKERFMGEVSEEFLQQKVEEIEGLFSDGFQFSDLSDAVVKAMEIAQAVGGLTGSEKREMVVELVRRAYKSADPDIPWIPEPVETWIEDYVLANLVPSMCNKLIDAAKGRLGID